MKNDFFWVTKSTESDQQPSIDHCPGQHDRNNNHDQRFSVDFLLIRLEFYLVVLGWIIMQHVLLQWNLLT